MDTNIVLHCNSAECMIPSLNLSKVWCRKLNLKTKIIETVCHSIWPNLKKKSIFSEEHKTLVDWYVLMSNQDSLQVQLTYIISYEIDDRMMQLQYVQSNFKKLKKTLIVPSELNGTFDVFPHSSVFSPFESHTLLNSNGVAPWNVEQFREKIFLFGPILLLMHYLLH